VLRQLDTLRSFAPNLLRRGAHSSAATIALSILRDDSPTVHLAQHYFSLSQTDPVNDAANIIVSLQANEGDVFDTGTMNDMFSTVKM
jgi:hypothetical protein